MLTPQKVLSLSIISATFTLISSPVLSATIGLFDNSLYVSYISANNLDTVLTNQGNTVTKFSSLDANAWQQIANTNQLIVIPDQQTDLYAILPTATSNVIRNYVAGGGGLIAIAGLFNPSLDLFNGLFSWNIQELFIGGPSTLNNATATGTIFAGGPAQLETTPFISKVDTNTLPTGAKSLYATNINSTTLFVNNYNQGRVAFLGLDFSTIPIGNNWLTVTNTTVQYVAQSTPEPSNIIALITLGIFTASRTNQGKSEEDDEGNN